MNVGRSWAKIIMFQCETDSTKHVSCLARHAGLLVVNQSEASITLVLRSVICCPLSPLIGVSHYPEHEGLRVANHRPQGRRAVNCLADLITSVSDTKNIHIVTCDIR